MQQQTGVPPLMRMGLWAAPYRRTKSQNRQTSRDLEKQIVCPQIAQVIADLKDDRTDLQESVTSADISRFVVDTQHGWAPLGILC
jgi:hypothetical protein